MDPCGGNRDVRAWRSSCVRAGSGQGNPLQPQRFPAGSIEGRVLDDSNTPVVGAMVSVVGRTTAAATTDRDGRYTLRELPYGPYILSVHSRGYFKSRGRTVQLTTSKVSVPEIQLQLASARKVPVSVVEPVAEATTVQATQLAGFGLRRSRKPRTGARRSPTRKPTEQGETAWRLRHLPRSILKDAAADAVWAAGGPTGAAMVQPRFGRGVCADRVLQRPSAVRTAQPDDDRVVRSPGRNFRRARAAQRGVRLGQHTGRRRRVVDAGRDDAGRSGVVDRRRAPTSRSNRRTTRTSSASPTARSATTAATRRRSAPFARAPATSAASTDTTSGRCRRGSCSDTARATPATTTSAVLACGVRASASRCPDRASG